MKDFRGEEEIQSMNCFSRNWISEHLRNLLSSIYTHFYPLKQQELVLLDEMIFQISSFLF